MPHTPHAPGLSDFAFGWIGQAYAPGADAAFSSMGLASPWPSCPTSRPGPATGDGAAGSGWLINMGASGGVAASGASGWAGLCGERVAGDGTDAQATPTTASNGKASVRLSIGTPQ